MANRSCNNCKYCRDYFDDGGTFGSKKACCRPELNGTFHIIEDNVTDCKDWKYDYSLNIIFGCCIITMAIVFAGFLLN